MRLWAMLLLTACFGGSGNSESLENVCARVVECGTYGWTDQAECESGWIDSDEHGTECAYDSQYLTCAQDCLPYDCPDFEDCEAYCWVSYCL